MSRQMYQFDPKATPALTDLVPLSDEEAKHAASQCTFQQLITNTLNPNLQLPGTSKVTTLDTQLLSITNNVTDLQNDKADKVVLTQGQILGGVDSGPDAEAVDLMSSDGTVEIDTSVNNLIDLSALGVLDYVGAGDNVTIVPDPGKPGGILINSSSSTPTDNSSDFGSFGVLDNMISTPVTVADIYYPIYVDPTKFSAKATSNYVAEIFNISGIDTPCLRFVNDGTQFSNVDFNLSTVGAAASDQRYTFGLFLLKSSDSSIVDLGYPGYARMNNLQFPVNPSMGGIVQVETDDRIFVQVKNPLNGVGIYVQDVSAKASNLDTNAIIKAGDWMPTYTAVSGINSFTHLSGDYTSQQGYVHGTLKFEVDLSSDIAEIGLSPPIVANFTGSEQARGGQLIFVDVAAPSIGDGIITNVTSDSVNQRIAVSLNSAVGSGTKLICLDINYKVQS